MKVIRIILASLAMFLCVIFFVSFVAAILGAWTINRSLSDTVTGLLLPLEHIAEQTQQRMDDLSQRLKTAQGEVAILRSQVDNLTVEMQENRELRVSIATTVTTRLEPVIQVITQDLDQVRNGLTAVNSALDAVDRLPFVDLSLPRLERLQEIENNVSTLIARLSEMKASGERVGAAAQEVLPQVSQGLDTLDETAVAIQARLDEVNVSIVAFTDRLESLKQNIAAGFTVIAWTEIFMLAWLAVSQASLFSHAYRWARKP